MNYLFLDTNVLIHFQSFDTIKWNEVLNSTDPFTIVFTPIVISELDKHKYSQKQKLARKAKAILPQIEMVLDNASSCSFPVLCIAIKPSEETFTKHRLRTDDADDNLIASIIEFISEKLEGDSIILVTNDVGPRLKAKAHQISTLKPLDKYKLTEEPDELEKEATALRKELNELKTKIPNITLLFSDGNSFTTIPAKEQPKSKNEYLAVKMMEIIEQHAPLVYNDSLLDYMNIKIPNPLLLQISREQVKAYNERLNEFLLKYEEYCSSRYEWALMMHNSLDLRLVLENKGNTPAVNLEIELDISDECVVFEKDEVPGAPTKPEPPAKPKSSLDFSFLEPIQPISSFIPKISPDTFNFNNESPVVQQTDGYKVTYKIKSLKHNQSKELEQVVIVFDDINATTGLSINYKIFADNIPKLITGSLHLKPHAVA